MLADAAAWCIARSVGFLRVEVFPTRTHMWASAALVWFIASHCSLSKIQIFAAALGRSALVLARIRPRATSIRSLLSDSVSWAMLRRPPNGPPLRDSATAHHRHLDGLRALPRRDIVARCAPPPRGHRRERCSEPSHCRNGAPRPHGRFFFGSGIRRRWREGRTQGRVGNARRSQVCSRQRLSRGRRYVRRVRVRSPSA